jgi:S-DNA-T family DNA segregation ATPase FtsK/SpoIIIE
MPRHRSRASAEIALVNQFFKDYRINASIAERASHVAGASYISLSVSLGAGASIRRIEGRLRELAEVLSAHRGQTTPVRLRQMPLALELPHPNPQPITPDSTVTVAPHTMLCGQSFDFSGRTSQEIVDLSATPHVLIAGATGSGKSVLMTTMLWSLTANTSPDDLRIVAIDLKNEDLVSFQDLPHIETFAASITAAEQAISWAYEIKEQRIRIRSRQSRQRILLVIDELAELARSKETMAALASILAIGRSKSIGVVAATQKPLGAIVGSVAKANFTARLVGRVMSHDDARVAAGISGTGAEHLPGRGAFLRIEGLDQRRFQSYWLPDLDARLDRVATRWVRQLPIHQQWIIPSNQETAP